jgi:hypothetical protein
MKRPIKELLVLCSRGFPNRFHRAQLWMVNFFLYHYIFFPH